MRGILGLVGLLLTLAVVGIVVKKQLAAVRAPVPVLQQPAAGAAAPGGALATPQAQSQAIQQQYREAMTEAMQAPRPVRDEP